MDVDAPGDAGREGAQRNYRFNSAISASTC